MRATCCSVAASTSTTALVFSLATAISAPSADTRTPSGDSPTGTLRSVSRLRVSITTSALAASSLTYSMLPSGLRALPRGCPPSAISATTLSLAVSITMTVPDFSFGT